MSVTVTKTFATDAEAAAWLAGNAAPTKNKPASTQAAADTKPSAEAAKGDAPAESAKTYDWDKDVLPALQAYSKKVDRETFATNVMKKYGIAKVPELKGKPETFAELMTICSGA